MTKTINKTQQALLDYLDKMIEYSKVSKGGVPRIKLNTKQAEVYQKIMGIVSEHDRENEHILVSGNEYRGVEIYW